MRNMWWRSPVVRYGAVAGLSVVVTVMAQHLVAGWRRRKAGKSDESQKCTTPANGGGGNVVATACNTQPQTVVEEYAEVLWTNELTVNCLTGTSCTLLSSTGDSTIAGATERKECVNRFCISRNLHRLVELVREAQHTLDICVYTITSGEIFDTLNEALRRNVRIRILTDREMVHASCSKIKTLLVKGVPLRYQRSGTLMHHKFCIIDGPQRVKAVLRRDIPRDQLKSRLVSGSQNWTSKGFLSNFENVLITSNATLLSEYETEFERLWNSPLFDFSVPDFKEKECNGSTTIVQIH